MAGNGVVVAQHFGAGDEEKVRSNASSGILFLMILGVICAVVGVLIARPVFVHFVDVPDGIIDQTLVYFRIYALGFLITWTFYLSGRWIRGNERE